MKNLTQLIYKLKPVELRLLRSKYQIKQNGVPNRRLELLNLIVKKKVQTDQEAAKAIYQEAPNATFSRLKQRLRKDILNVMLLTDASKQYDNKVAYQKANCRKMILQADLLLNRGLRDDAISLLEEVVDIASRYEFLDIEVAIRDWLRHKTNNQLTKDDFEAHTQRINHCLQAYEGVMKAREYHRRIGFFDPFNREEMGQLHHKGQQYVNELAQRVEDNSSPHLAFSYLQTTIFYWLRCANPLKALPFIRQLLNLVQTEKRLYLQVTLGSIQNQLIFVYCCLGRFEEAIQIGEAALQNLQKGIANQSHTLKLLFLAHLYLKDYEQAKQYLAQCFENNYLHSHPILKAQLYFYQAYCYFFQGELVQATHTLHEHCQELKKEKAGWLLGYKLLEIYIAFESKEYYHLSYQLENFRKLIERSKEAKVARVRLIHKLAAGLLRLQGNVHVLYEKEKATIMLLNQTDGEFVWDFGGYELLRFEQWLSQQALSVRS